MPGLRPSSSQRIASPVATASKSNIVRLPFGAALWHGKAGSLRKDCMGRPRALCAEQRERPRHPQPARGHRPPPARRLGRRGGRRNWARRRRGRASSSCCAARSTPGARSSTAASAERPTAGHEVTHGQAFLIDQLIRVLHDHVIGDLYPLPQPLEGRAADADRGRRLRPRRDGAAFGRRHRLHHPGQADRRGASR